MASPRSLKAHTEGEATGDLARLLSTEARLEEMLTHARTEAAALVSAAREAAGARDQEFATRMADEVARVERDVTEERSRRETALRNEAAAEAARVAALSPAQIDGLARYVVRRVIGAEP